MSRGANHLRLAAAVLLSAAGFCAATVSPVAAQPLSPEAGGYRRLAPGVERTIPPESLSEEAFSWHDIVGVLKKDPNYGVRPLAPRNLAQRVRLNHEIWALEFTFKPMRFMMVDLPDGRGGVESKMVWYMVYHVRNLGDKPVRFVPRFLLHTHESDEYYPAYYPDRILPLAVPLIQRREDPRRHLLNNVQISDVMIQPSTDTEDNSVWAVTTWRDIDPKTDLFSIYVQGLTNAYKIVPDQNTGEWRFIRKTLQLNFWRPSDEYYPKEEEIRLGIPGDVDYRWLYR